MIRKKGVLTLELKKILQEEVMFDGVPMNDADKQKVLGFMEAMYWDAKQKKTIT